jgi:nitrogen fixation/metabolism regulation signal transduction histidine kinase
MFGSGSFRLLVLFASSRWCRGARLYVSVQFLTKSIESWFDVRSTPRSSGLALGRSALDNMLSDLRSKARAMALELSDLPPAGQAKALDRMREQAGVDEASIIAPNGAVIASASREPTKLVPDPPPPAALRQVRAARDYAAIETVGEKGLRLRVIVPLGGTTIADETRLIQLVHAVPPALAETAETVQSVYRDYRELSLRRPASSASTSSR